MLSGTFTDRTRQANCSSSRGGPSPVTPRRRDRGFSLAELTIAVVIFAIVGTIVTTALVGANKGARDTAAAAQAQGLLTDVTTGLLRDISGASSVTALSPTSVQVLVQVDHHCTRTTWSSEPSSVVTRRVDVLTSSTCIVPTSALSISSSTQKTVARDASLQITAFDRSNVTTTALSAIRRVGYRVDSGHDWVASSANLGPA